MTAKKLRGQETVFIYLLISFLYKFGISFSVAIYAMFLEKKGLNVLQINMVNVVFMVTMFVAEVPTGAIADVFGRRISVACALFLQGVCMFMYASAQSFWECAAAECVAAIGATCATGAFDAWLVDRLKHSGYDDEELRTGLLARSFAWAEQITHITGIAGGMIGASLAAKNPSAPWLAGGAVLLFGSLMCMLCMKEEYFVPRKYSVQAGFAEMVLTMRLGMRYAMQHVSVRFIMAMGFLQALVVMAPNMQWQKAFMVHLDSEAKLGWIWGGMSVFLLLGAASTSYVLRHWRDERKVMVAIHIFIAAGIAGTAWASASLPLSLAAFLLHELGRGMWRPIKKVYLNDHIPSGQRATIGSCGEIFQHLGGAIGLCISGVIALKTSISFTWIVMAGILAFGSLCLAKMSTKTLPNERL